MRTATWCSSCSTGASPPPGVHASAPLALAAMNASSTVRLRFDGVVVPQEDVISLQSLADWRAADRVTSARPRPPIFGVARTCCRLLGDAGADLAAELQDCRGQAYALLDDDRTDDEHLAARPRPGRAACELAVRAATALVVAGGGRSILRSNPAQRLLREAAFFTIQAQTADLRGRHPGPPSARPAERPATPRRRRPPEESGSSAWCAAHGGDRRRNRDRRAHRPPLPPRRRSPREGRRPALSNRPGPGRWWCGGSRPGGGPQGRHRSTAPQRRPAPQVGGGVKDGRHLHPAVPVAAARADHARTRRHDHGVGARHQPPPAAPSGTFTASWSPPNAWPQVTVAASSPRARRSTTRSDRTRGRAAPSVITYTRRRPGAASGEGGGHARQLAVERARHHRLACRGRPRSAASSSAAPVSTCRLV